MPNILLLFAHPALERSRVNRVLVQGIERIEGLTFHDLYEAYPDFYIDVPREQSLLLQHDLIIWQHPLYWYSIPPLLKQWIDLTLQHDWAYGSRGVYLHGKRVLQVVTAGGQRESYGPGQVNNLSVREFLRPLEQTARLCGMHYLPPYLIDGTHRIEEADALREREQYHAFLRSVSRGDIDLNEFPESEYSSDYARSLPITP